MLDVRCWSFQTFLTKVSDSYVTSQQLKFVTVVQHVLRRNSLVFDMHRCLKCQTIVPIAVLLFILFQPPLWDAFVRQRASRTIADDSE
jgi:hypothetical protein